MDADAGGDTRFAGSKNKFPRSTVNQFPNAGSTWRLDEYNIQLFSVPKKDRAMVVFRFDARHFEFDHGVRLLKQGYAAARDALVKEIERVVVDARAYQERLANGGEWIGEREDGIVLWDQTHVFEMETEDAHKALYEVRRAFIIALYHHWERSAAKWLGKDNADHEKLARFCAASGFGPSPHLDAVRCLANHLKHRPGSKSNWLTKLRAESPLFLPHVQACPSILSDSDLETIAAVVLDSGPPQPAP